MSAQSQPAYSGLASGGMLSAEASAMLNPGQTMQQIRSADHGTRESLYSQINGKLQSGDRIISDIETQARNLNDDAKTQYKAAAADVKAKEKALKNTLDDARKASSDKWPEVQARLAADYEAYATSIARAHGAASVGASSPAMKR